MPGGQLCKPCRDTETLFHRRRLFVWLAGVLTDKQADGLTRGRDGLAQALVPLVPQPAVARGWGKSNSVACAYMDETASLSLAQKEMPVRLPSHAGYIVDCLLARSFTGPGFM